VGQLRIRLGSAETRGALRLSDQDWKAFLQDPTGLVRVLVKCIRLDGTSGAVSVQLRPLDKPLEETGR
jgi:hypothetical protein